MSTLPSSLHGFSQEAKFYSSSTTHTFYIHGKAVVSLLLYVWSIQIIPTCLPHRSKISTRDNVRKIVWETREGPHSSNMFCEMKHYLLGNHMIILINLLIQYIHIPLFGTAPTQNCIWGFFQQTQV